MMSSRSQASRFQPHSLQTRNATSTSPQSTSPQTTSQQSPSPQSVGRDPAGDSTAKPLPAAVQPASAAENGLKPSRLTVPKPLYSQVRDVLLARIRGGEWGAGETLPNEFLLAADFGVSIGTIRRAIEGLEETGIVKRIQGRGTFVSGPGPSALQDKFCRLR